MKKRVNLRDSSKLDPVIFTLFFCALRAPGRRSRPSLPPYCMVAPAGGTPFCCGKTSGVGTGITRSAERYTSHIIAESNERRSALVYNPQGWLCRPEERLEYRFRYHFLAVQRSCTRK